jgi:hypothetical protein
MTATTAANLLFLTHEELQKALSTLPAGQWVSLEMGQRRAEWFRGQVHQHDPQDGWVVLTCFRDRPSDGPVRNGEDTLLCTRRLDGAFYSALMRVEEAGSGAEPTIALRQVGPWSPDRERRHHVRVPVWIPAFEARRRSGAEWQKIGAVVRDVSTGGLGLSLDRPVEVGDRLSLALKLPDGHDVLRSRLEIRHAGMGPIGGQWQVGGVLLGSLPEDQERIIRFVFAERRARLP